MKNVTVVDHPLVQHKLTRLRDRETSTKTFRELTREISTLLAYEVTRDLPLTHKMIVTPMESMGSPEIAGKKLVFAPILRAGEGMLEGMLILAPSARVAHIGLYRDPATMVAVEYYLKAPETLAERTVIVMNPLLATGGTASAAVERLKESGAADLKFVCILAAPEGLARFTAEHPDVPVWTAGIDRELDARGYILPGLGDAGDRLYGTR
ncbi:uracil phosphoribosyltransferase [Phenylobacterium aquaticum]|jgi:uracil phosphoribosyltransferase|uniref:uracil phosphoribosyltransferase n=1 Tax=Phenylobacterium aquaticum TaxID=1763816 RepID=UPI001F5DF632|nr:uracil phosphoribosyltransferase [Phenylobacterium aquaticum]MCI3133616.1 uracil phosphoribosyltransferase [Phenylobacterium aquaticum]